MKDAVDTDKCKRAYVLVTAARNEEAFIEKTIAAVISQTLPPKKWVIVSDASADNTDKIVQGYAERNQFIELLRIEESRARDFASKVHAFNAGLERLKGSDYEFVGNLDADVSFDASYFVRLVRRFERDPGLGLAGGFIYERDSGGFKVRFGDSVRSVAGAVQLFRRECYESVGGMLPLKWGGEDWYVEVMARMKGWRVESFPELVVFHHRRTGAGTGPLKYHFGLGSTDYSLGDHPLFVLAKCARRLRAKPYVAAGLARLAGFLWASWRREARPTSKEFVDFLRGEQKQRLRNFLVNPLQIFSKHYRRPSRRERLGDR